VIGLIMALQPADPQGLPALVPAPSFVERRVGSFELKPESVIVAGDAEGAVARSLASSLSGPTGFAMPLRNRGGTGSIRLHLDRRLTKLGSEGYRLEVKPDRVTIDAAAPAGLFYGCQTLRQLLPTAAFRKSRVDGETWSLPCVTVEDTPRFGWRGAMLDVARHFMPKEFVLKFVDLLAMHKMNRLHLHLTDDQGWRIEIKKYPKLTEVGAWRKETMAGHYSEQRFDGKPHGGFYTQDDIREIVRYAEERFISVVPEIEMPGHSQAALAAYPHLGNTDKQLEVFTRWGVNPNVYNVEDSTIQFQKDVLDEVMALFPSQFIHIGGDEVPKDQWKASSRAQELMKQRGLKDEHELQSWFVRQIDTYLAAKGRRLIGWDEILEGGLAPGATVMSWRGIKGGIEAAKAGHDVVMAPTDYTYLDYYQSRIRAAEPVGIGGYLPIETVYKFEPVPAELNADESKHVLGAQGQLWSEYIPNPKHMEYMAFPRLCALAEVVWSPKAARDWSSFSNRLGVHLERLAILDVNFRPLKISNLPPVGQWRSGETTETFAVREWDITDALKTAGKYQVLFSYTSGEHRLDIEWAEIVAGSEVVARDQHKGFTGGEERNNAYVLDVKSLKPGARYMLRASVRSDGGKDSNGDIYLLPAKS
jgi:hexosaminidase